MKLEDLYDEEKMQNRDGLIFGKKGTLIAFIVMLIFGAILFFSGSL